MRKRLPLFTVAVLLAASLEAQIRDFVPIVRPKINDDTIAFLEKLGDSMERDGYYAAAEALERYVAGFGSGFIYVDRDGTNYVVTNLHVVSQAETVTLEFQQKDGGKTLYDDCSVLAVDEKLDLALIALPSGEKPFKEGLSLSAATLDDGTEVWSAGYPGLGNTPVWQLGKGNITNVMARIPELADPDLTHVIQHSAPVDPGNSGGPLLVVDKTGPSGYSVVGVNTWKAFNRQATNFSIPSKAVLGFEKRALAPEESIEALLESRCRAFAMAAGKKTEGYKDLASYISYAYVAKDGEAILKDTLSIAPTKIRNEILTVFTQDSPLEGIRLAIAYQILSKLPEGEASILSFIATDAASEAPNAQIPARFSQNSKEIFTTWVREQGLWRLAKYPDVVKTETAETTKKKGAGLGADPSPYNIFVSGGALLLGGDSLFWSCGLDYVPNTYIAYGFEVAFLTSVDAQIAFDLRLQYPITNGNFSLIPYAGVNGGLFLYSYVMDYPKYLAPEIGIRLGYYPLHFGAAYRYYFTDLGIFGGSALSLYVGYGR